MAFVAVRLTVHINDSGPQAAIAILSSSLADDTRLLINVSTSGRPSSTPCSVKSHSCVRLVREFVSFSRSCGKWSNLELEADKGEWEIYWMDNLVLLVANWCMGGDLEFVFGDYR
jgi:hypothetical protein